MKHNICIAFSFLSLLMALILGNFVNVWYAFGGAIIGCMWFVVWAFLEAKNK